MAAEVGRRTPLGCADGLSAALFFDPNGPVVFDGPHRRVASRGDGYAILGRNDCLGFHLPLSKHRAGGRVRRRPGLVHELQSRSHSEEEEWHIRAVRDGCHRTAAAVRSIRHDIPAASASPDRSVLPRKSAAAPPWQRTRDQQDVHRNESRPAHISDPRCWRSPFGVKARGPRSPHRNNCPATNKIMKEVSILSA